MIPVYFLPAAEAELQQARDWYDDRGIGLGERFIATIENLLTRIGDNPKQFAPVYTNLRRAMAERFPYALYFRIETDGVYVTACSHTRRDPVGWQRRT